MTTTTRSFAPRVLAAAFLHLALFAPPAFSEEGAAPAAEKPAAEAKAADPLKEIPEAQRADCARLLELHNWYRAQSGRAPLKIDPKLCLAGQKFAEYMGRTGAFGHYSDGRSPGDRVGAEGYSCATWAENIANGATTPDGAVSMWVNSGGHYANMLGGCTEVGFGRSGGMWVAVFAVPATK